MRLFPGHVEDDAHGVNLNRFGDVEVSFCFGLTAFYVLVLVDEFEMLSYLMVVRNDHSFFSGTSPL